MACCSLCGFLLLTKSPHYKDYVLQCWKRASDASDNLSQARQGRTLYIDTNVILRSHLNWPQQATNLQRIRYNAHLIHISNRQREQQQSENMQIWNCWVKEKQKPHRNKFRNVAFCDGARRLTANHIKYYSFHLKSSSRALPPPPRYVVSSICCVACNRGG